MQLISLLLWTFRNDQPRGWGSGSCWARVILATPGRALAQPAGGPPFLPSVSKGLKRVACLPYRPETHPSYSCHAGIRSFPPPPFAPAPWCPAAPTREPASDKVRSSGGTRLYSQDGILILAAASNNPIFVASDLQYKYSTILAT